jgi:hypothetical protein
MRWTFSSFFKKAPFTGRIIYTLVLAVLGILAYQAGINIYHYPKPELSPQWSFFGTSDWSIFNSSYNLSYLYVLLNALGYVMKVIGFSFGESEWPKVTKNIILRTTISEFRLILTLILVIGGFLAFCAGLDIWHGCEPDVSSEWAIMYVYFYLCYFYFVLNVVDIFVNRKKMMAVRPEGLK